MLIFQGVGHGDSREPRVVLVRPDFLVVRKPSGMHCLPGRDGAPTLADWLAERYPELRAVGSGLAGDFGLVHRLDHATSGLVLVARNDRTLAFFMLAQAEGRIVKDYLLAATHSSLGLAGSKPLLNTERVFSPERMPFSVESRFRPFGPGRKRVACLALDETGAAAKEASPTVYTTEFISASVYTDQIGCDVTQCSVRILKGFRHQIRAHAAWMGMPIVGDPLYGGLAAERLFLHAKRIVLPDPESPHSGGTLTVED